MIIMIYIIIIIFWLQLINFKLIWMFMNYKKGQFDIESDEKSPLCDCVSEDARYT